MIDYTGKKEALAIAILIIITIATFSNTLKNPFIWDDKSVIVKNDHIKNLANIPAFFKPRYWRKHAEEVSQVYDQDTRVEYRPFLITSFALDYFFWGLNPAGYHLTNIFLHIFNVLLVFILVRLLWSGEDDSWVPFAVALLFATHPIHTESVTWIKNRSDLMASLFLLSSLLLFIKQRDEKEAGVRRVFYVGAILSFVFSLCSKAIPVIMPLVFLLYAVSFLKVREWPKAARDMAPFFAVMALYVLFRVAFLGVVTSADDAPIRLSMQANLPVIIKTLGYYIKLLILPVGLDVDRYFGVPRSFLEPAVLASTLCLIIFALLTVVAFRRSKRVFFFMMWIIFALIPVSNIIFLASRPIAEQRLYVPSIGYCALLAIFLCGILPTKMIYMPKVMARRSGLLMVTIIALSYSYATYMRNIDWSDPIIFWEGRTERRFVNARMYNNLGKAYHDAGYLHKAIDAFEKAVEVNPVYGIAYNNLGVTLRDMGAPEEAIEAFKRAIKARPDYAPAYNNLGGIYYEQGDVKKAVGVYKKAVDLWPDYAQIYYNLGLMNELSGKDKRAIERYKKAIKLDPEVGAAPYNNLGCLYLKMGKLDEGTALLKKALSMQPENGAIIDSLGWAYYKKGKVKDALKLLKKAARLLPDNPVVQEHLAVVEEVMGEGKR